MFVVMEGEVYISLDDKILATALPGEIVGEMALINSDIRSATVTAKTDCLLAPTHFLSLVYLNKGLPFKPKLHGRSSYGGKVTYEQSISCLKSDPAVKLVHLPRTFSTD